jgi:hypothetical protein
MYLNWFFECALAKCSYYIVVPTIHMRPQMCSLNLSDRHCQNLLMLLA